MNCIVKYSSTGSNVLMQPPALLNLLGGIVYCKYFDFVVTLSDSHCIYEGGEAGEDPDGMIAVRTLWSERRRRRQGRKQRKQFGQQKLMKRRKGREGQRREEAVEWIGWGAHNVGFGHNAIILTLSLTPNFQRRGKREAIMPFFINQHFKWSVLFFIRGRWRFGVSDKVKIAAL